MTKPKREPGKPGREPGKPGRKPGVPNRRSLELAELLQARFGPDYSPVLALAEIGNDEAVPLDLRVRCLESVAPYMHAKRAPVRDPAEAASVALVLESVVSAACVDLPRPAPAVAVAAAVQTPPPAPIPEPATSKPAPKPKPPRLELPTPVVHDHDPYSTEH